MIQKAQSCIHKGLIPILQALTDLRARKDRDNLKRVLDGFQLIALGSFNLSTGRRSAMAPDLFPQFRPLCAPTRPITDLLFGDGDEVSRLTKQLKNSQASETRLGYGAPKPTTRGRGQHRGRGTRGHNNNPAGRGHGHGNFLARGAPHHKRRGAHNNNYNQHHSRPQGNSHNNSQADKA